MLLRKMMLPVVAGVFLCSCSVLQKTPKKKKGVSATTATAVVDTSKKAVSKVKPYKEVITEKAITDSGFFKVHKIDDRYFFEIPDALLNKDILVVNRISKAAADYRPAEGMFGYAGDQIGEIGVQFCKGPNDKLFIKSIVEVQISKDSTENGMYRSVRNSNLQPILATFDIKAYSPDSGGIVIDMTDYLNTDNDVFFFNKEMKKYFGLGGVQNDKSYLETIRSYPLNLEIRTIKTYADSKDGDPYTFELNSSLVLLPQDFMKPRHFDNRIGYFETGYTDFDANPQGIENVRLITRWRLEPKKEDVEKYQRGELVEPKKPIVYYIDPATPKKWVPYLIQGVNDWQEAFEKAGFKNAIYALEAPTNDTTWSLEDARHNAIVYKPSSIANASGPHVHDSRTGEILETHINWYHNVMALIRNWYMVQASPNDSMARKMQFDDSLMGQLIRFVSSHEVGHTLGLRHNFGSSSTIPVDSLRSKRYVETNGFCPSIMDYARFNYVAQPEDSMSQRDLFPRIGIYDKWAIEWGYRWFPDFKTTAEEKAYLNNWVIERVSKDKRLFWGDGERYYGDPHNQTEDLGDDPVKASYYGIENLKRVVPNLLNWTKQPNEEYYPNYRKIYNEVFAQYQRYLVHVTQNVGGVYYTPKTMEQQGPILEFVSRERQRASIQFLVKQVATEPEWIINKKLYPLIGGTKGYSTIIQEMVIKILLSHITFDNLLSNQYYQPNNSYKLDDLFNDLKAGVWSELKITVPISMYRRDLQKIYVKQLCNLINPVGTLHLAEQIFFLSNEKNDNVSLIKEHMRDLTREINRVLPLYKDKMTQIHLKEVRDMLKEALEIKEKKN